MPELVIDNIEAIFFDMNGTLCVDAIIHSLNELLKIFPKKRFERTLA